jgi:hypothetical protein
MPRAYTIDAVRPVGSFDEAISAMRAPGFDPRAHALVEAPSTAIPATIIEKPWGKISRLSISHFGGTRVELDLDPVKNELAVLSDAYYPGWTAEVDGQPRDIYVVNGVFRGVLVGPGDKVLTFRFSPQGLTTSLMFALFGLILCIAFLIPWPGARGHLIHSAETWAGRWPRRVMREGDAGRG